MKLLEQIQGLWCRTLSPIEMDVLMGLMSMYDDKTILEAALISIDKNNPMAYMKKVLTSCKTKEKEEESSGSEWLDNFNKRFK